jgi:hypothetical protein
MHSLRNAKKIEAAARGGGARRESTPTRAVRDTDYAAGGARGR